MTHAMIDAPNDDEFTRYKLDKVEHVDDRYILTSESWGLSVPDTGATPEVGDVARFYGMGFGHVVRGVYIEGKGVTHYRTEAEEKAEHEQRVRERDEQRAQDLEEQGPVRDVRIRELPRPLRERIEYFQQATPNFRRDYETYELFACEEAAKIAAQFEGPNAVVRLLDWRKLPYEQQREQIDFDKGHSGNTFSVAVLLAHRLLVDNEADLTREHGAMCPLVGCVDYGCKAAQS